MNRKITTIAIVGLIVLVSLVALCLGETSELLRNESSDTTANNAAMAASDVDSPTDKYEVIFTNSDGTLVAKYDRRNRCLVFLGNGAIDFFGSWCALASCDKNSIETIYFSEGITEIGPYAFDYSTTRFTFLRKVVFEGDVESIGAGAFSGHPGLSEVRFDGLCGRIEARAFDRCSSKKVLLPASCEVAEDAFLMGPEEP